MIALIILIFVIVATSVASPLFAKRRHIVDVPRLHEFKQPHRWREIDVSDARSFLRFHHRFEWWRVPAQRQARDIDDPDCRG